MAIEANAWMEAQLSPAARPLASQGGQSGLTACWLFIAQVKLAGL